MVNTDDISDVLDGGGADSGSPSSDISEIIDDLNGSTDNIGSVFSRIDMGARKFFKYMSKTFKDLRRDIRRTAEDIDESNRDSADMIKSFSQVVTSGMFADLIKDLGGDTKGEVQEEDKTLREIRNEMGTKWNLTRKELTEFQRDMNLVVKDSVKNQKYRLSGSEVVSAVSDMIEGGVGERETLLHKESVQTKLGPKEMYLAEILAIAKKEGVDEDALKGLAVDFEKGLVTQQELYNYVSSVSSREELSGYTDEIGGFVKEHRDIFRAYTDTIAEAIELESKYAENLWAADRVGIGADNLEEFFNKISEGPTAEIDDSLQMFLAQMGLTQEQAYDQFKRGNLDYLTDIYSKTMVSMSKYDDIASRTILQDMGVTPEEMASIRKLKLMPREVLEDIQKSREEYLKVMEKNNGDIATALDTHSITWFDKLRNWFSVSAPAMLVKNVMSGLDDKEAIMLSTFIGTSISGTIATGTGAMFKAIAGKIATSTIGASIGTAVSGAVLSGKTFIISGVTTALASASAWASTAWTTTVGMASTAMASVTSLGILPLLGGLALLGGAIFAAYSVFSEAKKRYEDGVKVGTERNDILQEDANTKKGKRALGLGYFLSGTSEDEKTRKKENRKSWAKMGAGGGFLAGAGTGALYGSAGGPLGTLIGAGIGGIAGALAGAGLGAATGNKLAEKSGGDRARDYMYGDLSATEKSNVYLRLADEKAKKGNNLQQGTIDAINNLSSTLGMHFNSLTSVMEEASNTELDGIDNEGLGQKVGTISKIKDGDTRKQEFVKAIYPSAQKVADKLGIPVEMIIAQAGLETGWGKSVGLAENNMFGIKASDEFIKTHDNWKTLTTKEEFVKGKKVTTKANFRTYDSIEEGLMDYMNVITSKHYKKYWEEFKKSGNVGELMGGIAGTWATDSQYYEKWSSMALGVDDYLTRNGIDGNSFKLDSWKDGQKTLIDFEKVGKVGKAENISLTDRVGKSKSVSDVVYKPTKMTKITQGVFDQLSDSQLKSVSDYVYGINKNKTEVQMRADVMLMTVIEKLGLSIDSLGKVVSTKKPEVKTTTPTPVIKVPGGTNSGTFVDNLLYGK